MKKKQQDPFVRRFFYSRLFLIIAFFGACIVALGYARAYYQDYKIREEIAALEREVRDLESKKIESLEILKYVTSDAFVEEKARTELNMKKPGEQVVVIQREGDAQRRVVPGTSADRPDLSNREKWWYYFTHQPLPGEAG